MQKIIHTKYGDIEYRILGKGTKTIVALHGFGHSGQYFSNLEKEMPEHRFIAISLPFHGNTEWLNINFRPHEIAEVIDSILLHENIKTFSLLGHSLGGRLCVHALQHLQQQPQQLILLAPAGFQSSGLRIVERIPLSWRVKILNSRVLQKTALLAFSFFNKVRIVHQQTYRFIHYALSDPRSRQQIRNIWASVWHFKASFEELKSIISQYAPSTLIVIGQYDALVPKKLFKQWKGVENVQIETIEAGHELVKAKTGRLLRERLG